MTGDFVRKPPSGSWPQFKNGNMAAATHGARSAALVDPIAAEIAEEILKDAPDFLRDSDRLAVMALARTEARIRLLSTYLEREGLLDSKGKPRPAAELLHKMERLGSEQRARIGFDVASRIQIQRNAAGGALDVNRVQVLQEQERGRQLWADAEARTTVEAEDAPALPGPESDPDPEGSADA